MTIYDSISRWLQRIIVENQLIPPNIQNRIDLESLPEFITPGEQNTALFSNPNDSSFPVIGGQTRHVITRTWYIKRTFFQFQNRLDTEAFMEALQRAIKTQALKGLYPQDGRQWRGIGVEGGIWPYQRAQDNSIADYQVTLRLEFIE